jgi:hypothetical protein
MDKLLQAMAAWSLLALPSHSSLQRADGGILWPYSTKYLLMGRALSVPFSGASDEVVGTANFEMYVVWRILV